MKRLVLLSLLLLGPSIVNAQNKVDIAADDWNNSTRLISLYEYLQYPQIDLLKHRWESWGTQINECRKANIDCPTIFNEGNYLQDELDKAERWLKYKVDEANSCEKEKRTKKNYTKKLSLIHI